MKNSVVETITGAVVIAIAAVFFFYVYTTTDAGRGKSGYKLTAEFENVEGIGVGSDVRMAGIKIGSVTNQDIDTSSFQAVVTMVIDPKMKLPDDTTAKVTSEGLLGGKFISLEAGGSEKMLKDGDRFNYTQGAIDIWSLISQFMFENKTKDKTDAPAQ
jgi:phospholipid/cholesterol/gamma-HCH transport system substrate-binding protein